MRFKLCPRMPTFLQRLRRGDAAAFTEMVDQFSDQLFGLADSLTGNAADAEDVLQQTILGAFRRIGAFEGRSSIKTWLERIVANQASKASGGAGRIRRARLIDERLATPFDALPPRRSRRLEARKLTAGSIWPAPCWSNSPPEHREVLVLRECAGNDLRGNLGQALKLPRGTVRISGSLEPAKNLRRRFEKHFT